MWTKAKEVLKWIGFLLLATFIWLAMLCITGYTESLIPFLVSFIVVFPVMEEWFKSNHSNTVFKAHLFGILEFGALAFAILFAPSATYEQKITIITAKLMALMMHWATGMLHYRANFDTSIKKKTLIECMIMHSLFNTCVHFAKIQSFEIVLFAVYFVLYIATFADKVEVKQNL